MEGKFIYKSNIGVQHGPNFGTQTWLLFLAKSYLANLAILRQIICNNCFSFLTGVFAAAHDLKTEWVVIKGISGYADCNASLTVDWVPYACTMAASVMNNILSEPIVFEQWPHYQSANNYQRPNTQNGGTLI